MSGEAPYRLLEGAVHEAQTVDTRATLVMDGASADKPFDVVLFGDSFTQDGPALASLGGARIRVRGALGMFQDTPQLRLDNGGELQVLRAR